MWATLGVVLGRYDRGQPLNYIGRGVDQITDKEAKAYVASGYGDYVKGPFGKAVDVRVGRARRAYKQFQDQYLGSGQRSSSLRGQIRKDAGR